ncbi:MAG: 50S ribosomal protein L11 methyltransferase [Deltaproteobacteria bacterium]|jgi:ribosomal protein L11 methyltransferase|nr:50S ribosomal protein L11 methyltransferase [Deltaproteobacteria bacterium]
MRDWLGLTLAVPPALGEVASALLFEAGAQGIWEDQPDRAGRLVFRAGFPLGLESRLMAELPAGLVVACESFSEPLDSVALSMDIKPGEDYSETWKKDLKPFPVGPRLWICPSWWTEPLKPGPKAKILKIDPGPAFGSGRHPSTFLCLRLLGDLVDQIAPARVLDVGSGSGVLSLAAAILFPAAQIEGLDSDPDTLEVAAANLKANQLADRASFSGRALSELEPGYGLILANLTLGTLTELAPEIRRLLSPTGLAVVSGLLADQTQALTETCAALGLALQRHVGLEEWSALQLAPASPESSGAGSGELPRELVEGPLM